MSAARAVISTGDPSRYLLQVCRHLQSMGARTGAAVTVEYTPDHGQIRTPAGELRLDVSDGSLVAVVRAPTSADLALLEERAASSLERFGHREGLAVSWTPEPSGSPVQVDRSPEEHGAGSAFPGPRRGA
jgi:hypothetical protein